MAGSAGQSGVEVEADDAREQPNRVAGAAGDRDGLLRTALELVPELAFVVRCAWCGRFELGGLLVEAEAMPSLARLESLIASHHVSHGVCGPCFAQLDDALPAAT